MILVIGSVALNAYRTNGRESKDLDVICHIDDLDKLKSENSQCYPISGTKWVIKTPGEQVVEAEIAWEGSTGEQLQQLVLAHGLYKKVYDSFLGELYFAHPSVLLTLKLSHRYLRNSPFFHKTMTDIQQLRKLGYSVPDSLKGWLKEREAATYTYKHPKLDQNKKNFFDTEGVTYKYDHDSIHLAVARREKPAYTYFKPDQEEVWCSKEMWDNCHDDIKLLAVYEESCVLALERCLVPFDFKTSPRDAFLMALQKVCTSITSGWFREWAWENYHEVLDYYDHIGWDYLEYFKLGLRQGVIIEHQN